MCSRNFRLFLNENLQGVDSPAGVNRFKTKRDRRKLEILFIQNWMHRERYFDLKLMKITRNKLPVYLYMRATRFRTML